MVTVLWFLKGSSALCQCPEPESWLVVHLGSLTTGNPVQKDRNANRNTSEQLKNYLKKLKVQNEVPAPCSSFMSRQLNAIEMQVLPVFFFFPPSQPCKNTADKCAGNIEKCKNKQNENFRKKKNSSCICVFHSLLRSTESGKMKVSVVVFLPLLSFSPCQSAWSHRRGLRYWTLWMAGPHW